MALVGFEIQRAEIQNHIASLQTQLKGRKLPISLDGAGSGRKKHEISAEGRARIAAAQKKRWAASKKGSKRDLMAVEKAVVKSTPKKAAPAKKRKLSAEQRAALVERLKKARAARAAKRTAGEKVPF